MGGRGKDKQQRQHRKSTQREKEARRTKLESTLKQKNTKKQQLDHAVAARNHARFFASYNNDKNNEESAKEAKGGGSSSAVIQYPIGKDDPCPTAEHNNGGEAAAVVVEQEKEGQAAMPLAKKAPPLSSDELTRAVATGFDNRNEAICQEDNDIAAGSSAHAVMGQVCNGTHALADIVATVDDDNELDGRGAESPDGHAGGEFKNFLVAVLRRIRFELSKKFPIESDKESKWLVPYLIDHGFWMRREAAKAVYQKLKSKFSDPHYYRDIRVWLPEVEGGQACMPCCCTCGRNDEVRVQGYTLKHPARRIFSFDLDYYIMSRQYMCRRCEQLHVKKKEEAQLAGRELEKAERIQFTFMGCRALQGKQRSSFLLALFGRWVAKTTTLVLVAN